MGILVQTAGGYIFYLNGKSEIPNDILDNITRALLLNSSQKKEIWRFAYQFAILISCLIENRSSGDVTYFIWHGTRP